MAGQTPQRIVGARALEKARQRVGQTIDQKYRLTAVLGVGGMGVVYEAQHLFLDRRVALKVLHPRYEDRFDAAKRFLREAATLGAIHHRAIVEVLDGGFVDGSSPYLVMERLRGENLAQRIARRKGLRLVQTVIVMREMLKGLAAAHAKGVVHCDMKPENVFLVDAEIQAGKIKLVDFGVARIVAGEPAGSGFDPQRLYGTPEYMAPEQIVGEPLEPRTDLYGVGAVAYEAITGEPPFGQTKSPADKPVLFGRILREPPPPVVGAREEVPPRLAALVEQLLAKRIEERPESATEVLHHLEDMELAPITSLPRIRAVKPI